MGLFLTASPSVAPLVPDGRGSRRAEEVEMEVYTQVRIRLCLLLPLPRRDSEVWGRDISFPLGLYL